MDWLLIILLNIVIFLGTCWYLLTSNLNYWKDKGIAYDKPTPLFGSFFKIIARQQHISQRLRDIYKKFKNEPYVGIVVFNKPYLVLRSPDVIKTVLIKEFNKFSNRSVAANENVDPIAYHTLFSSTNPTWKILRSKLSPVFTSGKMKLMLPLMNEVGSNLVGHLKKRNLQTLEFKEVMSKYSIDIISSCAFGLNANCLTNEDSEIRYMAKQILNFNSAKRAFSVMCYFFFPIFIPIFRPTFVDQKSSKYFMDLFFDTMKKRKEINIKRNDLIDLLDTLRTREHSTEFYKFDDAKMASQAVMFFNAGSETTNSTLSFALYELALHPEIQARVRNEIINVLDKYNGETTYEGLQEMKYLDMVIQETLRLYPLTSFLDRQCVEDYTFQDKGFTLEKGVAVFIPACALHFDPEYFPDPYKFDPERFNEENKRNIQSCTYIPFGEGPRNCIGERFALLASKVGLVSILSNFAVKRCEKTDVPLILDPSNLFMQAKNGISLKIEQLSK